MVVATTSTFYLQENELWTNATNVSYMVDSQILLADTEFSPNKLWAPKDTHIQIKIRHCGFMYIFMALRKEAKENDVWKEKILVYDIFSFSLNVF